MAKVLIIGLPGTGKTYLSEKFIKSGVNAYDADMVEGLSQWVDMDGTNVQFPENADKKWLSDHMFIWNEDFLTKWLEKHDEVILLGISSNAWDLSHHFDKILYLYVDQTELRRRLDDSTRVNPMGKSEQQKQSIFKHMEKNLRKAKEVGAIVVDAKLSAEIIKKKFIKA